LKPVGAKLPHLIAIDSFRGLAILLVIAGHVIGLSHLHVDTFSEKIRIARSMTLPQALPYC